MKLKESFITHDINGEQIMVATGNASFSGMVRSNAAAAFIVDCLKKETSLEEIVEEMLKIYDAPKDVIEKDVQKILAQLRSIEAIEE